jgi:hypothetical protein
MSPRDLTAFRLPQELLGAMRQVRDTERIPITAQIELAVEAWLKARGTKVEKRTARPRKRAKRS